MTWGVAVCAVLVFVLLFSRGAEICNARKSRAPSMPVSLRLQALDANNLNQHIRDDSASFYSIVYEQLIQDSLKSLTEHTGISEERFTASPPRDPEAIDDIFTPMDRELQRRVKGLAPEKVTAPRFYPVLIHFYSPSNYWN